MFKNNNNNKRKPQTPLSMKMRDMEKKKANDDIHRCRQESYSQASLEGWSLEPQ